MNVKVVREVNEERKKLTLQILFYPQCFGSDLIG